MSKELRPRVAAIGAGLWGKNIVRVLKQLEGEGLLNLIAVVDINEERGRRVAREWGVPNVLTDVDELSSLNIEAAAIAVPVNELANTSLRIIKQGIHVFIEKPVSTKAEDIERLIRECRRVGVIAQPGFIVRYDPVSRKLKEIMSRERPVYIVFKRLSSRPVHRRTVSIIYDLMIHDIDLTGYLLGWEAHRVLSVINLKDRSGVPQSVQAIISFGDVTVTYIADGLLPVKVREVEAYLPRRYVRGVYTEGAVYELSGEGVKTHRVSGEEPLKAELREFILSVKGVPTNAPTLKDALEACRIAANISMMVAQRDF